MRIIPAATEQVQPVVHSRPVMPRCECGPAVGFMLSNDDAAHAQQRLAQF